MKKLLIFSAVIGLLSGLVYPAAADEKKDVDPPVITVSDKKPVLKEGEMIDIREYVEVSDEEGDARLVSFVSEDLSEAGDHEITLLAVDESGNLASTVFQFHVMNEEEYDEYYRKLNFYINPTRTLNINIGEVMGDGTVTDAYSLAQQFIGMGGDCFYVAQQFTYAYLGNYAIGSAYAISPYDAQPGDVIYYTDGGIGYEHWAIYLGGDRALQGNFNGTTIIGNVYLNNASEPQFRRIPR